MPRRKPRKYKVGMLELQQSVDMKSVDNAFARVMMQVGAMKDREILIGFVGENAERRGPHGDATVAQYMAIHNVGGAGLPARPWLDRSVRRFNATTRGPLFAVKQYIEKTKRIRGERVARVYAEECLKIIKSTIITGRFVKKSKNSRGANLKPLTLTGLAANSLEYKIK